MFSSSIEGVNLLHRLNALILNFLQKCSITKASYSQSTVDDNSYCFICISHCTNGAKLAQFVFLNFH